jgi:hypothetical protein
MTPPSPAQVPHFPSHHSRAGCQYQFGIFPSGVGCFASYTKCAGGVPTEAYCQLGLAYDHRIHTCNWPDLLMEYAGAH